MRWTRFAGRRMSAILGMAACLACCAALAQAAPAPAPLVIPEQSCREMPSVQVGKSANLLPNASFEHTAGERVPEYWSRFGDYLSLCSGWRVQRGGAFHGETCLRAAPGQRLDIPVEWDGKPPEKMVFSVYLKRARPDGPDATCALTLWTRVDADDGFSPGHAVTERVKPGPEWQRFTVPATLDLLLKYNRWGFVGALFEPRIEVLTGDVLVDAVQLEAGHEPTPFAPEATVTRKPAPSAPETDDLELVRQALQRPHKVATKPIGKGIRLSLSTPITPAPGRYMATGGVFFPRGTLDDKSRVGLLGPNGRPAPVQTEVLARYGGGGIRSLYVASPVTIRSSGPRKGKFRLVCGATPRRPAPASSVRVNRTANGLEVVTGPLRFTMRRQGFRLFDGIWLDLNGDGRFSRTERVGGGDGALTVVDDEGNTWSSDADTPTLAVERAGPLEVVVRATGWHRNREGVGQVAYIVRVHAFAGSKRLLVEHTFENLDPLGTPPVLCRSIDMRLPLVGVKSVSVAEERERTWLVRDALCFLQRGTVFGDEGSFAWRLTDAEQRELAQGKRLDGLFRIGAARANVYVFMPDFTKRHPKELRVDPTGVTVGLWPGSPEVRMLSLRHGLGSTHQLWLEFTRAGNPGNRVSERLRTVAAGIRLFPDPRWTLSTGAALTGPPPVRDSFPAFESRLARTFDLKCELLRLRDISGMFHVGDVQQMSSRFWLNQETAQQRAYYLQYLRTGDRRCYDVALTKTQHTMDVDMDHVAGGQYVHNMHHALGRGNSSHNYPVVISLGYLISGRMLMLDFARRNARQSIRWLRKPWMRTRSLGWSTWNAVDLWDTTREKPFLDTCHEIPRRIRDNVKMEDGKRTSLTGTGCLYAGTNLNALMRIHRSTGDEVAKAVFLDELKHLVGGTPAGEEPSFGARSNIVCEPLAYAYALTGDKRYVEWGFQGLYNAMPKRINDIQVVLGIPLLSEARRLGLREPAAGPELSWGFKRQIRMFLLDETDQPITMTLRRTMGGEKTSDWWFKVYAPDGTLVQEKTYPNAGASVETLTIPQDGRKGAYRMDMHQGYPAQVALELSTPRVVLATSPNYRRYANAAERYWFFVPEGTTDFTVEILQDYGRGHNAAVIFAPNGKIVVTERWPHRVAKKSWPQKPEANDWRRIKVPVLPAQSGRLWSILVAVGGQYRFHLTGVPPFVSLTPEAHFVPEVEPRAAEER